MSEEDQLVAEVLDGRDAPERRRSVRRRPLPDDQLDRVNAVVGRLCLLFGITGAVIAASMPGASNASIAATERGAELTFFGGWPAALDDDMLAAVVAHELGHVAAHHPESAFGQAKRVAFSSQLPIDRRFLWATELTADRFALCGAAASPERLGLLAGHGGGGHPDVSLRVHAARLFAASDRYRDLTGRGPGTLAIAEVDAAIARLLPDPERAIYRLGGVDVLETPRWLRRRWERRRDRRKLIES